MRTSAPRYAPLVYRKNRLHYIAVVGRFFAGCSPAPPPFKKLMRATAGSRNAVKGLRVEIFRHEKYYPSLDGVTRTTLTPRGRQSPQGNDTLCHTRRVGELQGGTPLLGSRPQTAGAAPYPLGEHILCKAKYNVLYFTIKRATEQVARFRVKYERWVRLWDTQ